MTRTAITKFVATALAVASLGIAGPAQAEDGQGVAIGEPTPGQPVPAQPTGQGNPGTPGGPATPATPQTPDQMPKPPAAEEGEVDYSSAAYFNSQEAKDRYKRYCNMKDAEPSHSDKKFCEDYRKHHGTTSSTGNQGSTGNEGPTGTPGGTGSSAGTNGSEGTDGYGEQGYEQPEGSQKAEEPSKGALPFTGLEIWQLGLLGLVLIGGGFGARRLLVS